MTPTTARTITPEERAALEHGQAYLYAGRVIPIIRGGAETDDEKAAREAAEAAAAAAAASEKTFTQADVDRIVQERLARAKATPPEDYEELKAAAARLAEIEEANKTELQKATDRADAAEKRAQEALERAKQTSLRSAIVAEAAKKNVVDPDAALALLDRSSLQLDDDGMPTNIAEAMDALLEAKPYLASTGGSTTTTTGAAGGSADQGARGSGGVKQLTSTDGMTPEQIATAVADGRLETYLKSPTS